MLVSVLDYPGHLVNCSPELAGQPVAMQTIVETFGRPYMGGIDRHGTIATGTPAEVEALVEGLLAQAPARYFLGADCTLPSAVDWENIRSAIDTAHSRGG